MAVLSHKTISQTTMRWTKTKENIAIGSVSGGNKESQLISTLKSKYVVQLVIKVG